MSKIRKRRKVAALHIQKPSTRRTFMAHISLFHSGAEEGSAPYGRVNLRSIVAGAGGAFVRLLDSDGNPAPFSYSCDPPGSINEDDAREIASNLQRGKSSGTVRSCDWRLIPESAGGSEAPSRFLVQRPGQGGHHADRPPCPGARWERIGDSYRWVVELGSLTELV